MYHVIKLKKIIETSVNLVSQELKFATPFTNELNLIMRQNGEIGVKCNLDKDNNVVATRGTPPPSGADNYRVKKFVPLNYIVHFSIKNSLATISHSLLPEKIKTIMKLPWFVDINNKNCIKIQPQRGIIDNPEFRNWFLDVIINENPYIALCSINKCFCAADFETEAQNWFIERGFEIDREPECTKQEAQTIVNMMSNYKPQTFFKIPRSCIARKNFAAFVPNIFYMDSFVLRCATLVDTLECNICFDEIPVKNAKSRFACTNCLVCDYCFFQMYKTIEHTVLDICPNCKISVDLINICLRLQSKFHLKTIKKLHRFLFSHNNDFCDILEQIKQEAAQIFPQLKTINCIFCKSKRVDAISDLGVYKCNECSKCYCLTCDLSNLPTTFHNCSRIAMRCPGCSIFIERISGCNHIKCSFCNTEFLFNNAPFVDNFYIDLSIPYKKVNLSKNASLEDIMTRVAQMPLGRFRENEKILRMGLRRQ